MDLSRPPAPILVFDIETVPDIALFNEVYLQEEEDALLGWGDFQAYSEWSQKEELTFPAPLFHMVVSVCAVFVDPINYTIRDGFKKTIPFHQDYKKALKSERDLIHSFWSFAKKYKDHASTWYDHLDSQFRLSEYQKKQLKPLPLTFSGYNIVGFDLPVLEQRSVKHLLTCPIPEYAKKVGLESYRYRYAQDKVFDICEYLSNFQGRNRSSLNAFSLALGLGGKMEGMHGSQVGEYWFSGQDSRTIEDYCAVDVLITYGVLLAVQKFRGILDEEGYKGAVEDFKSFLLKDGKPAAYRKLYENSPEYFSPTAFS